MTENQPLGISKIEQKSELAAPLPLSQNPAVVYLARLSSKSRRTQQGSLDAIAEIFGGQSCLEFAWSALRYQHTAAMRSSLAERYAPATANRMLSALRGVLKEAWRLGLIDAEDYHRAADVANIKSQTLPAGRALSKAEIQSLWAQCAADQSAAGIRDAALLVLLRVGLRRSEIVQLDVSQFEVSTGQIKVLEGKGRKDRTVYVPGWAIAHITKWLELRNAEPGPLLMPVDRWGKIWRRRLTDQAVLVILQKRGKQAGLSHFTPHDWRRTYAGDLLDRGVDIVTVQRLLGHANPATTAKYDRRGEESKRAATQLLAE
ncbi:MAG TPA: site-specific integrase [Chroococcidiopsis sp.]